MGHPNVARKKEGVYWDYWEEMVKASVHRETREIPAIADAAQIKGKHVLDAGYDPGRLILPFVKLTETITCVRESDWPVEAIERLIYDNRLKDHVQVIQAPSVGLPIDDDVAESTYCVWVIHYDKSRWEKIVHELIRVTKPGAPVVIGFSSGDKDLPQLQNIAKPGHLQKCKEFDAEFPTWIRAQGWKLDVRKIPLDFVFKSPEWAEEVLGNTFLPKHMPAETHAQILQFLKDHRKGGKCVIEQEMRLYVIREA